MALIVKVFKERRAEPGDPSKLLVFEKLERPAFSGGIRT
jgi:hypothetical protein